MPLGHMGVVYVVDDEPLLRRALSRHLAAQGYRVTTFADGTAVTDAVAAEMPDAIIVDFYLPDMRGTELRQALTKKYGRRRPVCILISSALEEVPLDDLRSFDGWMEKPLNSQQLLDRLQACLRYRRTQHSGVQSRVVTDQTNADRPVAQTKKTVERSS